MLPSIQDFALNIQSLLSKDFTNFLTIDTRNRTALGVSSIDNGLSIDAFAKAKIFAIISPEHNFKTIAIVYPEPLDYSYKLIPQLIQPSLDVILTRMADRFQVQGLKGETRDYLSSQIPYNNTIYIYAPSLIPGRSEIIDFFFNQGKQVYIRDLDYYQQQWEARRPDVFISHDSTDKPAVAEPLYHALTARGLKVWLDKYTLKLGDSLTEKINEGIAECRYGVLILSKAFLANERWAKRELNSFSVKDAIGDSHKLIPIWHDISESDLAAQGNYWLIDKLGGSSSDIEKLADDIMRVVKP